MTTLIRTLDLGDVMQGIVDQLSTWQEILDRGIRVSHSERLPEDPSLCPWVGVYQVRSDYENSPRVIGFGSGLRRGRHTFAVVMQEADASSGAACKRRLELVVRAVTSAILSDPSIGGRVLVLEEFAVAYEFLPTSSGFIQQAVLQFTATGNTGAETV